MTIKRDDLDRRAIDFSDVATERRLPPVHPGEILRHEFLKPLLNDIVLGRRGISTDTALRLGRYFGTTPEFWISLQARHDLDVADRTLRFEIEREIEPYAPDVDPVSLDRAGAA